MEYIESLPEDLKRYLESTNERIKSVYSGTLSEVPPIKAIVDPVLHQLNSQGKMLRSTLCVCTTEMLGGNTREAEYYAAAVELTHNASLIHDDIVDGDIFRRGDLSVFGKFGLAAGILAGDTVISMAVNAVVSLPITSVPVHHAHAVISNLSKAWLTLASGALKEYSHSSLDMRSYEDLIYCKTAVLYESALTLGAIASEANDSVKYSLSTIGRNFGMAFQIADDLADMMKSVKSGVPCKDLANYNITFPIVMLHEYGDEEQRELAQRYLEVHISHIKFPALFGIVVPQPPREQLEPAEMKAIIDSFAEEEFQKQCKAVYENYIDKNIGILDSLKGDIKSEQHKDWMIKLMEYGITRVISE
jgi:geranylgeranyl pyrophosphate synthase